MFYDYLEAVCDDVKSYIKEEYTAEELSAADIEERLNDDLWAVDSITGNASGSYTFSSYIARGYVMADMNRVLEALEEYDIDKETIGEKFLAENWEWFDVAARCHVLSEAIHIVLNEK